MEGDIFEGQIINESPEPTHHSPIVVDIVLILILVNQIEISCYHPRPLTGRPDVTKLLKKLNLILIPLWFINAG